MAVRLLFASHGEWRENDISFGSRGGGMRRIGGILPSVMDAHFPQRGTVLDTKPKLLILSDVL